MVCSLETPILKSQEQSQGYQSQQRPYQNGQGIGFINILNNFISIDQIINSDEIISPLKFVPKGKLPEKRKVNNQYT